jgi:putative transcriptional regulator
MVNINSSLTTRSFDGMIPRIKEIRTNKGLMQKYVAEQLGIKQQQLSDWENGKAFPRHDRALKLAKILNVNVNDLYEEEVK